MSIFPYTIDCPHNTVKEIYHGNGNPRFRIMEKNKNYYCTYKIGHTPADPVPPVLPLDPSITEWVLMSNEDILKFNPGRIGSLFIYIIPLIGDSTKAGYLRREF